MSEGKIITDEQRLASAPDLQTSMEYGKVDGKKVLMAITRSSRSLGITRREEITRVTPREETQDGQAASAAASGQKRGRRDHHGN